MTMSIAEEERCKELLVKLKDAIDKRGIMLDKLGKVMDEMVSSLATSTPLLVSAAADSTPISTATNKVFAVANAAPSADAALTDQARNRCSRSGPDTNARDKSVAALIGLTTGTSMVVPVPVEHSTDSSSKLLSTSELDKRMTTRCLMSCSNDNTASQTSAFMPDAASGPPSTAALLDIAITSPEPTVATLLVRDGTSVLTSTPSGAAVHSIDLGDKHIHKLSCCQLGARKLFDEMPIRSTMGLWPPSMKWDERQLWPPPLGSATILQFFIALARFKMMRTKLAEVELNVVESFMQKWLGAIIHVVSRGSYSVWRSLVTEKDMQGLVVKKARCILWLFDLIVELVGRARGSNLVHSFIENDLQRRCYINFIRRVNDKRGSEGLEETKKAFNFLLNYVGHDVASGPVWMEYIAFLKSMPVVTPQEESHRMTTVWKVYQKAILVPNSHVEQLWKDYDNFENSVSRTLAKGLLSEYQSKYNSAKAVYMELKKYIDNIDWNMLAIPPTGSYKGEKQCMTWKRLLAFKKGNPQRIDATTANRHVTFTYEQCLMYLYHHPDVWYDYAMWHAKNDSTDSTIKIFQHALKVLPDSEVLKYAFAELEESRGAIQPAKIMYESLVAENESMTSLAYIQFIRFLRGTEGIEAAHKYFLDAQKLLSCIYDVYVAYATMAFCLDKDAKVAQSVFEAGLKLFMHEPGYILEYADFLRQGVWLTSASSIWTPGRFYLTVLDNCLYASIKAEPPQLYYQKGVDATDAMVQSKVNIFSDEVKNCTTYNSFLQAQFMSLEGDGHLRLFGWDGISWKPLVDVLNVYSDDCAYHTVCGDCVQDKLSMGVLQVPWEPGGADFFRKAFHTTAWGQAESQGGENVMNRLASWAVGLTVQWADLLGEYKKQ